MSLISKLTNCTQFIINWISFNQVFFKLLQRIARALHRQRPVERRHLVSMLVQVALPDRRHHLVRTQEVQLCQDQTGHYLNLLATIKMNSVIYFNQ